MIINDRCDLDRLAMDDPAAYATFLAALRAGATCVRDVAVYPPGYGERGYVGDIVTPEWREELNLTVLHRFGFSDLAALPV